MRFAFSLFILCFFSTSIYASVYNLPTSLINIPVYRQFEKNDLVSGLSSGIYTQDNLTGFEFDAFASYSPFSRMMIGLNMMTKSTFVFHFTIIYMID